MKSAKVLVAFGLALNAFVHAHALAAPATSAVDPLLLPYAKPDTLAKLPDGRSIHLKCMGAGSPTVILTAGLGDWSETWRKVQPSVATTTRVCAWDRAGFGFSDGSPQPQTVSNTTSDLEAALKSANVHGPYVIVGHSLGGYESLRFTDLNRDAVVGMVLIDPSLPDQFARLRKAAPSFMAFVDEHYRSGTNFARSCASAVKTGKVTVSSPDPDGCLAYPATYPKDTAAELMKLDTQEMRWAAKISLVESFEASGRSIVDPSRNYGAMPLVVLTAMKMQPLPPGAPQTVVDGYPAFLAEWVRGHDELAALSSRGGDRRVPDSSHYIQIERPDAVIDAIQEVVAQSRHDAKAE